jgi:hypothetical protein
MQPYFDQKRKTTSKKWKMTKKNKNGRRPQIKRKMIFFCLNKNNDLKQNIRQPQKQRNGRLPRKEMKDDLKN